MNLLDYDFKKLVRILNANLENGLNSKQVEINRHEFCTESTEEKKRKHSRSLPLGHLFDDVMRALFIVLSFISYFADNNSAALTVLAIFTVGLIVFQTVTSAVLRVCDKKTSKYRGDKCRVRRNGKAIVIGIDELVPGDMLIVGYGEILPCDGIIADTNTDGLRVTEFGAGGATVEKLKYSYNIVTSPIETELGRPYNDCLLFADTLITSGEAEIFVCNTGIDIYYGSELVSKANDSENSVDMISDKNTSTIHSRAAFIGSQLSLIWILISLLICALGVFVKIELFNIFWYACAVAVAAGSDYITQISEAVTAVRILSLYNKHCVIKNFAALDLMCDVNCIIVNSPKFFLKKDFYVRSFFVNDCPYSFKDNAHLSYELILGAALTLSKRPENSLFVNGKSVDRALSVVAARLGISKKSVFRDYLKVYSYDYDEITGIAFGLYLNQDSCVLYVRGTPESVLKLCEYMEKDGKTVSMNETAKYRMRSAAKELSDGSELVIAIAKRIFKSAPAEHPSEILRDMSFIGFIGLYTPIRAESAKACNLCAKSDMNVILMTDEQPESSFGLAKSVSIIGENDYQGAMTANEYVGTDRGLFIADLAKYKVFCGLNPSQQRQIVEYHKESGDIVGCVSSGIDGVLPQKESDVSFALQTDICPAVRRGADIILLKPNMEAIPESIKAARNIYKNTKHMLQYMIYIQLTLALITFISLLVEKNTVYSLSAVITLGFLIAIPCALIMGFDEISPRLISRPVGEETRQLKLVSVLSMPLITAVSTAIISECVYRAIILISSQKPLALTCAVITLYASAIFSAISLRADRSIFKYSTRFNPLFLIPAAIGASALLFFITTSIGSKATGMVNPGISLALVSAALGLIPAVISEFIKLVALWIGSPEKENRT